MNRKKPIARFVFGNWENRVSYSIYKNEGKFEIIWSSDDEGGTVGKLFDTYEEACMDILNRFKWN